MVVMSGPEATAGSTFIFFSRIGIPVPAMLESTMAVSSAIPVQSEMENACSAVCPLNSIR